MLRNLCGNGCVNVPWHLHPCPTCGLCLNGEEWLNRDSWINCIATNQCYVIRWKATFPHSCLLFLQALHTYLTDCINCVHTRACVPSTCICEDVCLPPPYSLSFSYVCIGNLLAGILLWNRWRQRLPPWRKLAMKCTLLWVATQGYKNVSRKLAHCYINNVAFTVHGSHADRMSYANTASKPAL